MRYNLNYSTYCIDALRDAVSDFASLPKISFGSVSRRFNTVVSCMHRLCAEIDALDCAQVSPAKITAIIRPAFKVQGSSPFVHRLQMQPRGYPGDFETIEYILEGKNRACIDTVAHSIEQYALVSAPASQHRNKVTAQAEAIACVCRMVDSPKILIVACGGGADIVAALPWLKASRAQLVINDVDPDAIRLCKARIGSDITRITAIGGNVVRSIPAITREGPYDLVLAGGLFDYVPTGVAGRLLGRLADALKVNSGRLFLTNIGDGNPYKTWMVNFANWHLIERSEHDLRMLMRGVEEKGYYIDIRRDITGLTFLVNAVPSRTENE